MTEYAALLERAREAMQFAYSPYSDVKVGAALLTADGKIYTGCNVENASFGATLCAERVAVAKAISDGIRDFKAIAVISSLRFITPCGICRQTLSEFAPEIEIVMEAEGGYTVQCLTDLLPASFGMRDKK